MVGGGWGSTLDGGAGNDVVDLTFGGTALGGDGDDSLAVSAPTGDTLVDCGAGVDVLTLDAEPLPGMTITGCETVVVQETS